MKKRHQIVGTFTHIIDFIPIILPTNPNPEKYLNSFTQIHDWSQAELLTFFIRIGPGHLIRTKFRAHDVQNGSVYNNILDTVPKIAYPVHAAPVIQWISV